MRCPSPTATPRSPSPRRWASRRRASRPCAEGLAGYVTTADGRRLAFALYVNNVRLGADPEAIRKVAGEALGEMAAAVYDAPP